MTAETDLLPLPEAMIKSYQTDSTMRTMTLHSYSEFDMQAYARANVAHATAAKGAEIEALRAEVALLRVGAENERLHQRGLLDRERERAEQLAEALREMLVFYGERVDAECRTKDWRELEAISAARAALEQENDDA